MACAACSLLHEKNRATADYFLSGHADFILRPAAEVFAQQMTPPETGECLQLLLQLHGTDVFFAAVLERTQPIAQDYTATAANNQPFTSHDKT